jgi:hypothetical protein
LTAPPAAPTTQSKPGPRFGARPRWEAVYAAMDELQAGQLLGYDRMGELLGLDPDLPRERTAISISARKALVVLRARTGKIVQLVRGQGYELINSPAPDTNSAATPDQQGRTGAELAGQQSGVDLPQLEMLPAGPSKTLPKPFEHNATTTPAYRLDPDAAGDTAVAPPESLSPNGRHPDRRRVRLTGEQRARARAQAAARYQAGDKLETVADMLGVSIGMICNLLDEAGVRRRKPGLPADELATLIAEVADRYGAGASVRQIATVVGRSHAAVHGLLVRAGITRRPPGGMSSMTDEARAVLRAEAADRYTNGASMTAIAAALGRSKGLVRALLDEAHGVLGTSARPANQTTTGLPTDDTARHGLDRDRGGR